MQCPDLPRLPGEVDLAFAMMELRPPRHSDVLVTLASSTRCEGILPTLGPRIEVEMHHEVRGALPSGAEGRSADTVSVLRRRIARWAHWTGSWQPSFIGLAWRPVQF